MTISALYYVIIEKTHYFFGSYILLVLEVGGFSEWTLYIILYGTLFPLHWSKWGWGYVEDFWSCILFFVAVLFMLIFEEHMKSFVSTICCFIMLMFSWWNKDLLSLIHSLELGGRWWCPPLLFSRRNESLKLIVSIIIKIIIEFLQGDSHQGRDNNSLYLGHKKEIFLILDFSGIWFTILNVVYLSDCLHLPFVVDIISAIEFDKTGDHLATGDRGGRVVLFERTDTKEVCFYFWGILIIIISLEAELRTDYSLGFSLLQTVSVACWKSKRFREDRLSR